MFIILFVLIHQANCYVIDLPIIPTTFNEIRNVVLEKASSSSYSNLLIHDLADGHNYSLSPTLALLNRNLDNPIASYVFNRDFDKLKGLRTVKRMDIVLLYTLTKIHVFLEEGKKFLEFNRFGKFVFIIVTFEDDDFVRLKETMRLVWKAQIWNFIYIFWCPKYYEMYFNPFTDEVVDVSKVPYVVDQFKKFDNLQKYPLKISIAYDPPRIMFNNGEFEGEYIKLLEMVRTIINATFILKAANSVIEAYEDVKNHRTEFSVVGSYYGVLEGVKYADPFLRDDLVVVTAKASKIKTLGLISIFSTNIWNLILLTIFTFTVTISLIAKRSFSEIFVYVLGATAGYGSNIPFKTFERLPNILLIGYTFFGLIIACGYSSSMLDALITTKYYPEINTLSDLKASKLTLASASSYIKLIPQEFDVVTLRQEEILFCVFNGTTNLGYIMPLSYASNAEYYTSNWTTPFRFIKESIAPGFQSFYFYQSSPFVYKITDILKKLQETGLFNLLWVQQKVKVEVRKFTPLKTFHIRGAFVFMGFGHCIALCAFLGELLISYKRKMEKVINRGLHNRLRVTK